MVSQFFTIVKIPSHSLFTGTPIIFTPLSTHNVSDYFTIPASLYVLTFFPPHDDTVKYNRYV